MRAFFMLFGGFLGIATIVCAFLTRSGKVASWVVLLLFLIATTFVSIGKHLK